MFQPVAIADLPSLAWLFESVAGRTQRLLHGRSVQVGEDRFHEGYLDIPSDGDPSQALNVFGSAAEIGQGSVFFVTPSHNLECLYFLRASDRWAVSNSLPFLLERHGVEMPWDINYGGRFASVALGIDDYDQRVLQNGDVSVVRVVYRNLVVERDGTHRLVDKPDPPRFESFAAYIGYLESVLKDVFATCADYRPVTTCSSGYDSAAGAVLASRHGCTRAVTLTAARGGADDSGEPTARTLGLQLKKFERPEARNHRFADLAPFLATGLGGEDVCYSVFASEIHRSVFLTGFHGDKIWEAGVPPNTVLKRGDVSGGSLQEFRLDTDFVHVPVPMIAARRHPEIAAISQADEMRPWRMFNSYDRPIARRLVEEAGVPRTAFGQQKKAASVLLFSDYSLLNEDAQAECESLVPHRWVQKAQKGRLPWQLRGSAFRLARALKYRHLLPFSHKTIEHRLVGDWCVFLHDHPHAALQFCAAFRQRRRTYGDALAGVKIGFT